MAEEQQTEKPASPEEIRESVRTMCKAITVRNRGREPAWCTLVLELCDDHERLHRAAQQKDGNKETGCLCPDCVTERMAIRANAYGVMSAMVFDEGTEALVCFQYNPDHLPRVMAMVRKSVEAALESHEEILSGHTAGETKH